MTSDAAQVAAIAAAIGIGVVALFQVALASGAPLGRAAWGGRTAHLSGSLRIASGVAAIFWVAAGMVVLARAGFEVSPIPEAIARWGTWVLVGVLAIGGLMNAASSSRWERFLWAPLSLTIAVLCVMVAAS